MSDTLPSLTVNLPAIAMTLHILSAVVWVGGMFFAHLVLRPAANSVLEPSLRLPLMSQVLTRFFPWVWAAVVLLWATGLWLIFGFYGGMGKAAIYIHIMLTIGAVMTVIFIYIFFIPFPNLKQTVEQRDFKQAGQHLARIRQTISTNLWLGLITIIVATAGRYIQL